MVGNFKAHIQYGPSSSQIIVRVADQPQRHNMSLALVEEAFQDTTPEPETQTKEPLGYLAEDGKVDTEDAPATIKNATEMLMTPNGRLELVKTCFNQELRTFHSCLHSLVHSEACNRSIWLQVAEEKLPLVTDGYTPGYIRLNM